jgi:hypothetical protein
LRQYPHEYPENEQRQEIRDHILGAIHIYTATYPLLESGTFQFHRFLVGLWESEWETRFVAAWLPFVANIDAT